MHCTVFYFVASGFLLESRAKVRKFPGLRFTWGEVFFSICLHAAEFGSRGMMGRLGCASPDGFGKSSW